jgi:hypothetical protein
MGKGRDFCPQLREMVVKVRKEGEPLRKIAEILHISSGSVTNALKVEVVEVYYYIILSNLINY